ncbi:MAG: response regulator [Candidatus Latescibacteria bacterium]|nr:response regulator [Candidatus Latescibacterota bacterium]
MIFIDLIHNIALLVALSVIYQLIIGNKGNKFFHYHILSGFLFGGVGVIAMMTPLHLMPGIIFDGRSIILGVSGLFGGPVAAGIAGTICALYRQWLGGGGAVMGVSVIAEASMIGVIFYKLRRRFPQIMNFFPLLGFGFLIHVIMVLMMLLLPAGARLNTIRQLAIPVLLIYPIATVVVCKVFLDQEEKIKNLSALRESEKIFKTFMDNSPIYVFFKDDKIRSVRLSSNYEKMLGKPIDELLGKTMYDLFPSELAKKMVADDLKILLEEKHITVEEEFNGRFYTTTKFPIHIEGKPTYLAGFTIDITERKQAEKEKERMQAQLLQAQKMEAVGQLAGGVAHDFNNMLTVIIGHAEIALNETELNEPLAADLKEILKAARHSAELTQQLLGFARKQIIRPKIVNLNNVISEILKMIKRLIGEDIDLKWTPGKDLWNTKIDPAQINQILANLLVNARDAIVGNGKITIETGNAEFDQSYCENHVGFTPGQYVMLSVSDDGCGMDKKTLSRIYEPFYTTKSQNMGTGLGLATVYGIIKQNNGFINVYSEPGSGTTFRIYFTTDHTISSKIKIDTPTEILSKGTETILIIEDEQAISDLAKIILEKQGYNVLVANTPVMALDLVENHPDDIHLVLSDVVLPEMNGRELLNRIKVFRPNIKSLFMSGYTANVIVHRGILEEGVQFIQKPFNINVLVNRVREVLDQKKP